MTFDHGPDFDTVLIGNFAEPAPPPPSRRGVTDGTGDEELMALAAQGNVAAFTALVERHSPRLYRVAYRMLGNSHEAEDTVQDAFIRLWQSAPKWSARGGGLAAWLHRVAVNRCLDRLRQFRIVTTDVMPEIADGAPSPERSLAIDRLGQAVGDALGALPGRHRAAIVLCYFEGLRNTMAAEVLELNLKAMESLLFRARRNLRELLEARGVEIEDLELLQ